ncbi:A24 family peptidase [Lactiplantibacillus herbarum]|uniref:prepilin peptidase n=1 Tax=Lactiplantibacillus herbarum TaxID=1670446 RepID=UPI00064FC131|nr:A24 family peptidase [Lactiplantibacillus herbarum]
MLLGYYFIIGACLGSFITCLAERISSCQPILGNQRSQCPNCHHQLRVWQLIPIIGIVAQRGHCYDCHASINLRSTLIELLFGLLLATNLGPTPWQQLPLIMGYVVLLFNSLTDYLTFNIYPATLIIPGILGYWQSPPRFDSNTLILVTLLLGLYSLARFTHQFGLGDVDVLLMISLMAPAPTIISSLMLASFAALLVSIITTVRRLPFVPFISWGFIMITQLSLAY